MKLETPLILADDEVIIHLAPIDHRGGLFLSTSRMNYCIDGSKLPKLRKLLFFDKAQRWLDRHARTA